MRNLIAAKDPGECEADGVMEVTVVVEPEAAEKWGLTAGLLEEDVTVVGGFFMEEREGGGGRMTGVAR